MSALSALSAKQRADLEAGILAYLCAQGPRLAGSAEALRAELGAAGAGAGAAEREGQAPLLERKWTAVVRLQRKVLELEAALAQAGADASAAAAAREAGAEGVGLRKAGGAGRRLPRGPTPRCVMQGHREPVCAVALHPVFSLCASASEDGTIKLWDAETGTFERSLKGHTGAVHAVQFNSQGTLLVSCAADLSVKLWDCGSNQTAASAGVGAQPFQCIKTMRGHDHTISAVVFAPDGESVFSCSRDGTIKMWEVGTGFCTRTFTAPSQGGGGGDAWIRTVTVSPDGELVAGAGTAQDITVWSVKGGGETASLSGHEHVVEHIAFPGSADHYTVVQRLSRRGAADAAAAAAAADQPPPAPSEGSAAGVAGAADGDDGEATNDGQPGGAVLVSCGRDNTVRVWDVQTESCLRMFVAHENWVRCCLFHPSAKFVISCADDKSIRVFDLAANRCLRTIEDAHAHFVNSVAMHATLPILVSGAVDRNLHVWECR